MLKTLKDLQYEGSEWINLKSLKAEAIKWVKHIDEAILWHRTDYRENHKIDSGQLFELQTNLEGQKLSLINFFNITSEDLK